MYDNTSAWAESFNFDEDDFTNSSLHNCTNVTDCSVDGDVTGLPKLNIPYAVMEALVAIVAVIGNALIIIVFHRERRLRRRTNYYIISLALADFLVGLLGIPFAILVSRCLRLTSLTLRQNQQDLRPNLYSAASPSQFTSIEISQLIGFCHFLPHPPFVYRRLLDCPRISMRVSSRRHRLLFFAPFRFFVWSPFQSIATG